MRFGQIHILLATINGRLGFFNEKVSIFDLREYGAFIFYFQGSKRQCAMKAILVNNQGQRDWGVRGVS